MALSELARTIKESGNGVRGFEKAATEALSAAKDHPDMAIAYLLLSYEATGFAEFYDRMPVTKMISDLAQVRFAQHAAMLDEAADNPAKMLEALNKISAEILIDR